MASSCATRKEDLTVRQKVAGERGDTACSLGSASGESSQVEAGALPRRSAEHL